MIDYNAVIADRADQRAIFRVSLVAASLIAVGLSLGAWQDKQDARTLLPHMIVAGQNP
jgi:hypothetical protein